MEVVIVAPELHDSRLAGQVQELIHAAHAHGDNVRVLYTGPHPDQIALADHPIEIIPEPPPLPNAPYHAPFLRIGEVVAGRCEGADLVYFQETGAHGFHTVRSARYRAGQRPLLVTILTGWSDWRREQQRLPPAATFDELALDFAERYAAQHSDWLIAPERFHIDWAVHRGWQTPSRLLASADWSSIHAQMRRDAPVQVRPPKREISVDVVVPHYNHGRYLPHVLLGLSKQTAENFSVIVVDDGSTDADSLGVFDEMRTRYTPLGWQFHRTPNLRVEGARNFGAAQGKAEYLSFIDADDVPVPTFIERMSEAIQLSGADGLTTYLRAFESDDFPYDLESGQPSQPAAYLHHPIGAEPLLATVINTFGSVTGIFRRAVFQAVGGFTSERGIGFEDYEWFVRMMLAGYKLDVVPEYLFHYRVVHTGMTYTMSTYSATLRVMRHYRGLLQKSGMGALAPAFQTLYKRMFQYETELARLRAENATLRQQQGE